MDERTSKRILALSREQLAEEEEGERMERQKKMRGEMEEEGEDESSVEYEEEEDCDEDDDDMEIIHKDGYVTVEGPGLTAEQEAMVSKLMGGSGLEQRQTLADIILAKIEEKQNTLESAQKQEQSPDLVQAMDLPPKVVQVYTDIGRILSSYTSGKLPKAFKIIPSLSNWEEILYLTKPHLWTPQAMYAATRIFASNLNPKMAQRFYNLILLDAIRADIHQHNKLNYHYYHALFKSAYKPAAFFKGIVLPLSTPEAKCTLREAIIIASALKKLSIPLHHSAVAVHKLATGEYTPSASIFLKEILNKKYSLPASVIQSLVLQHFAPFAQIDVDLPVLWHQTLLVFVQRYKHEILSDHKFKHVIKEVIRKHSHHKITLEIRRELFGSAAWNEERKAVQSDAMQM